MTEGKSARLEEHRPLRRATDDYEAPTGEEAAVGVASADTQPDVLLDIPTLKVEEIHLEVEDLNARVSLQAEVLSLLKLHVGADVSLGRVSLDIKGVDAVAQLKVRLDQVGAIIDDVMTTIDNNPQILSDLTRGLGQAASEVGRGAGEAVGEVGRGAGEAVGEVGRGAGEAVGEVGRGAGQALEEVGEGAGSAVESVGDDVGEAVGELGQAGGRAVDDVIDETGVIGDDVLRRGHEPTGSEARHAPQRPAERGAARGPADRPKRRPPPSDDKPRRVRRPRPE